MIRLCAFADEAADSLDEQIAELKKHNIKLLELRSIDKKNVSEFTDEEAIAYSKKLKDNGITVWSIGSPLGKIDISNADEHMKTVKRVCEIAKIFEAKRIRMFSFYNAYEKNDEVFDALKRMSEIAKKYDVILCHENEKEIYGDIFSRVEEIMAQNIENMRFVFDPANFIQCGVEIPSAIDKLFDKTDYFHIKDVVSSTGELVPSGYGDGFIEGIIEKITKSKKDFVLTLEPHLNVFSGYAKIDNTEMKLKFQYKSTAESFAAATNALKDLLTKSNYKENGEGWIII
jgi:sugar phosphate isomerase/epimerase